MESQTDTRVSERAHRILVVDDDAVFANRLSRAISGRGYEALEARTAAEAFELAVQRKPDAAVVDLRIDRDNGLDLAKKLIAAVPGIRVVMLTGYGSIANALEGVRAGIADYLTKPADLDQILSAIHRHNGNEVVAAMPERAPSLDRVEWEHIQRVLHDCGGNITRAAETLGIHRRSLQRKLARFPAPN